MSFIKSALLLLCLLLFKDSKSQPNSEYQKVENLKSIIPPSPTSSSLGKYADIPVSLYTGVPDITIPLYDLVGRSVSVPIKLSYHASGIKVSEVASWVGLGWGLNAGGVITRSVRGLPDESSGIGYLNFRQQYLNKGDLASGTGNVNTDNQNKINVADGKVDSEPDNFSFSAQGRTYKLFFKGDGTIITVPYSQIKITADFASTSWLAILEDGTKLFFGGMPGSNLIYVETINSSRYNDPSTIIDPFPTSWYLREIESATGEKLTFTYSPFNLRQDNSFFQTDYFRNSTTNGFASCSFVSCIDNGMINPKGGTSIHFGTGINLSAIESGNCRIEFLLNPSEREDFRYGKSLGQIKVFSKFTNTYIKTFSFTYTYSTASNSNSAGSNTYHSKRLKLVRVDENVANNESSKSWKFEYNLTSLPSVKSFAQDHWGYYNGATLNSTLLPQIFSNKYIVQRGFNPNYTAVGNREPNASFIQAEMLNKIIYPTGGSSVFVYEPNGYQVSEEQFQQQIINQSIYLTSSSNPFTNNQTSAFVLTKEQYVRINFTGFFTQDYLNDFGSTTLIARCTIKNSAGNAVGGFSLSNASLDGNGNGQKSTYLYLPAGTYSLYTNSISATNADLAANDIVSLQSILYYEASAGNMTFTKMTGGVRIKAIEDNDETTGKIMKRFFKYEQEYVIHPFSYESYYLSDLEEELKPRQIPDCVGLSSTNCYQKYLVRNSVTKADLGAIQGGTIGYGKITTQYGDNASNGYMVSEFWNVPDENQMEALNFPYPPTNSKDWQRGSLLKETYYDVSNKSISRKEFQYDIILQPATIFSYKIGWAALKDRTRGWTVNQLLQNIAVSDVKVASGLLRPSVVTLTNFVAGQPSITTTTGYFYDNPNNLQSTRNETTNSKGEVIKIRTRTPLEKAEINGISPLSYTASVAIDAMIVRNIISPVLQQEQFKSDLLQKRSLINYRLWDNQLLQPENVEVKFGNSASEIKSRFSSYDVAGNILEQQKVDDYKEVYIWGYNKFYPVAKIINADYYTAIQFVNLSLLDDVTVTEQQMRDELNKIRTGLLGSKALVTTYTYKPLVGITSETDPNNRTIYYEYDDFNLLKTVRDHDYKILKIFNYKYQQNP